MEDYKKYTKGDYTYEHLREMYNSGRYRITVMAEIPLSIEELEKLSSIERNTLLWEEYPLCSMLENGDFIGRTFDAFAGIIYEKRLLKEDYGRTWHVYRIEVKEQYQPSKEFESLEEEYKKAEPKIKPALES